MSFKLLEQTKCYHTKNSYDCEYKKTGAITQILHTNCTLESTLSHTFLFLELRYVWGSLISRKNMQTFA